MDAARRIFARSSVRWSVGVLLALLLAAFVFPLGCRHDPAPVADALPAQPPAVRVRIISNESTIKLTATGLNKSAIVRTSAGQVKRLSFPANSAVPVSLAADGWRIGQTAIGPGAMTVESEPDGTLAIEGRPYRGSFHFIVRDGSAFDVVNRLPVDDYLKGVLSAELYPEFHIEAYKAQAVAARTFAIYASRTAKAGAAYDLHNDIRSQMYGGIKSETAKSVQATNDTAGIVVAYGAPGRERIFKAYYSSCCGGATQSNDDAFAEPPAPVFVSRSVGRRCDISTGPHKARFEWPTVVISREELARRLKLFGADRKQPIKDLVGVRNVEVAETNAVGRPVAFTVEDARGARFLLGSEHFRTGASWDGAENSRLHSAFVTPVVQANSVRFENGRGFGHGVGLCQWCIEAQAKQGVTHEAIIRDAYPGAVLLKGY